MAKILIHRNHDSGIETAREAAEKIAQHISSRYGIDYYWESECLYFNRTGVDGCIVLGHDFIEISAQLGLLLSVFRDAIESEIHDQLDSMFDG